MIVRSFGANSRRIAMVSLMALLSTASAFTQQSQSATPSGQPAAEQNVKDLAKQTQNPVGDIVTLPLQFNFNSGGGLQDENLFNLNIQPVIPIHLTPGVNMIVRTIVPIESFPGPGGTRFSGFGDIQE